MQTNPSFAPSKHCPTCNCPNHGDSNEWFSSQVSSSHNMSRLEDLRESRLTLPSDPKIFEVGSKVINNRTVWFKSVSPKPSRITLKVSSPDRPNLKPSTSMTSFPQKGFEEHRTLASYESSSAKRIEMEMANN